MKSYDGKSFDAIVRHYKSIVTKKPDRHLDFCLEQTSLSDVIEVAAKAINNRNKIHGHQTRVGRVKLNFFASELLLKEHEIKQAKTFDELLTIIESVKCDRIAKLTHYDTATRIGAYLDLFPDRIYLHTGTKDGVTNLLGSISKRKFITINELPNEFQQHGLTASEFEDIFCIFKDYLKPSDSLLTEHDRKQILTDDSITKKVCC